VDLNLAIQYILSHADGFERARLDYLISRQLPRDEILADFRSRQRADGGWPPFWAPDYSSLDATCFRLAQAEQAGLSSRDHPFLTRSIQFLALRQNPDGSWEEDPAVADQAPPWAQPGDRAARLYLTANCGYWLAKTGLFPQPANQAGVFLKSQLEGPGLLPSYLQASWLSASLFYRLGQVELAEQLSGGLLAKLETLSAGELAWLLNSYIGIQGLQAQRLAEGAVQRLLNLQQADGRWESADGAPFHVHTTLEALFGLSQYGQVNLPD
jgi:hypothetical protein